ncbi:R3H and coiled-coil domain-containing protein 1 isoform X2 [Agelaius phoeniceus]|uniref:R3H and coiled-coil domain-containing protein 1 isoform X2 n=1 Tax=Agelaius phoeniceus TaxID=39638 RepID=UPI00405529F2
MEREEPEPGGRSQNRAQAPHRHPLLGRAWRVLLFPPLSSRLRYLIHRTVENMELLSSFSVGEGWRRRTVICHSAVRLPNETSSEQKAGPNPSRVQRPVQPWGRGGRGARLRHPGDTHGDTARASVGSGRISRPPRRKPEKAPFVPRGGRKKANWRERESPGDGDAAPGGENGARNSSREQQELGRAGGSPRRQQEPEDVPGKGSAEHPLCDEEVPSLGNGGDSCEREGRDEDCSHSPRSAHHKHPPQAGQEEPSQGSTITAEHHKHPPQAGQEEPGQGSTIAAEHNKHPPQAGQEEPSHGSTITAEHHKHPPQAGQEEPSHGSTISAEGSEFQAPLQEKESSRDSRGSECGGSSVPLENHGGSRTDLPVPAPGVPAPGVPAPGVPAPAVPAPGVPAPAVPAPGVPAPAVPAPAVPESQTLQSSSSGQPRSAEQHSRNSQGVQAVPSPGTGQVEQEPLQKVLEGPAEALAAPELSHGADPSAPGQRKEEEEDKEGSGVAEALRRGLDLAAGDREGTRLEDDCTAELLAEIVGNLSVKDISIERITVDYPGHGEAQVSEGDLGHVTEIYDFPSSLQTEDLLEMFSDFHESGFKIQWVDDTHALGIFSSSSTASQALGRRYPCLKIRPLLHASKQAKSCSSWGRRGRRRTRPWPGGSCPTPWAGGSGSRSPWGAKISSQNPWSRRNNPKKAQNQGQGRQDELGCAVECMQGRGCSWPGNSHWGFLEPWQCWGSVLELPEPLGQLQE